MKPIRSSQKTKPDPLYYKRKADRWIDQRQALWAQIEEREEATGKEAKELRTQAARLDAKVKWALFQLPVSQRMRDQLAPKEDAADD